MNAIIYPVFSASKSDRHLFEYLSTHGTLPQVVSHFASRAGWMVLAVTDDEDTARRMRSLGARVVMAGRTSGADAPGIPFGGQAALRAVMEMEWPGKKTPESIALLDYRNPDLTEEVIDGLVGRALLEEGPFIGLSRTTDHPAQCNYALEVLNVELHLRQDPDVVRPSAQGTALWFSLSYPVNLRGAETLKEVKPGFYHLPSDGFADVWTYQGDDPAAMEQCLHEGIVMYYEGHGRGRRVLPPSNGWPAGAMAPLGGRLDEAGLLVLEDEGQAKVFLRGIPQELYMLEVWGIDNGELLNPPVHKHWIPPMHQGGTLVAAAGGIYLGPVAEFAIGASEGVLLALSRHVREGHGEITVPFEMDGGGFELLENSDLRRNMDTGRIITGRQDLPDIFEPDGSLALAAWSAVPEMLRPGFPENARGIVLDNPGWLYRGIRLGLPVWEMNPNILDVRISADKVQD